LSGRIAVGAEALDVCVFGINDVQMLALPDAKGSAAGEAQKVDRATD
jgi:hypothetical protein